MIKREDWDNGVRLLFVDSFDEIDKQFEIKLKKESKFISLLQLFVKVKKPLKGFLNFKKM